MVNLIVWTFDSVIIPAAVAGIFAGPLTLLWNSFYDTDQQREFGVKKTTYSQHFLVLFFAIALFS